MNVVTAPAYDIPFNRVSVQGNEQAYIAEAIASGHLSGDGAFTRRCSQWLEQRFGVPRVLLTPSCTHALDLAALLLEIEPGDEVIVPSFTFSSTANAFVLRGAQIVFSDIRADTLNLDERLVEQRIGPHTRAIVPVHYAGVGCEMDQLAQVAASRGIGLVEDNAQGLFGSFHGRPLGTFGSFAALSFHETKNVSCGEGGALFINDPAYVERAEILREKGTDRTKFFRGQLDKYTWVDLGSSYLPSELQAAYLFGQLEAADVIQRKRCAIWNNYADELAEWAAENSVRLPGVPAHCSQAYHMYYLIMPSLSDRQRLIAHLAESGILATFHYLPLHLSAMGQRFGAQPGDCPVSEELSDRLVRLPFFNDLHPREQRRVIDRVRAFRCSVR